MKNKFGILPLTIVMVATFFLFHIPTANAATISAISPSIISPGLTELTITGSGFGASAGTGDRVCFYETIISSFELPCVEYYDSTLKSWSDSQIVVTVPADPDGYMVGGYIHVYVDYVEASGALLYNVQPVIASTDYTTAVAGLDVTITGKYLKDMFGVAVADTYNVVAYINGVPAQITNDSWTKTGMVITVPAAATTGNVSLVFALTSSGATITATGPVITVMQPLTNDTYSAFQQYLSQVNVVSAWSAVGSGTTPIVAVIDDGVYINHPDLKGRIWKNSKEVIGNEKDDDKNRYIDDIYGWDFVSDEGEMTVRGTHGTLVAGIIGAARNNSEGVSGIAVKAKIMPLIVCDDRIGCPTDMVTKAITYAVDNGATVINLSLGSKATTGYKTAFNKAVKYAYDHGVVIVAAAGNGDIESGRGQDLNFIPQSPVCNDVGKKAVIGVGAVDSENYLTSWTNTGTKCVDAYAPGVNIISTSVPKYSTLGGYYDNTKSGTSFSAPIVTGIVALLRQKYPYMPVKEVVDRISNNYNSSGVIDAYKVLTQAYKPPVIQSASPTSFRVNRLIGQKTVTLTGRGFTNKTQVTVGYTKAKVKYIHSKKLTITFSIDQLSYGNNLITITGANKYRSIYRWLSLSK